MDTVGIWLLKAKAIALGNNYFKNVVFDQNYNYSHQQYPLLVPFFLSLFYKLIGYNNENLILLFYPIFYLVIIYFSYKIFLINNYKNIALLLAYIFSMLPALLAQGGRGLGGNADIFLVLINILIILSIYYKKYILLTILCGIASQIKIEGVLSSLIILLLPEKIIKRFFFFLMEISPFLVWRIIVYFYNIPNDSGFYLPSLIIIFQKILLLIISIIKEMTNINNWYIFWPVFFLLLLSKGKLSNYSKQIFLPYSFIFIFSLIMIFTFNSENILVYTTSTWDRMLLQISPFLFAIAGEKIKQIIG